MKVEDEDYRFFFGIKGLWVSSVDYEAMKEKLEKEIEKLKGE